MNTDGLGHVSRCLACGYERRDGAVRCPECGRTETEAAAVARARQVRRASLAMVIAASAPALVALVIGRALDRDVGDAIFLAVLQAPTALPVVALAGVALSPRGGRLIPAVFIAAALTVACQLFIFGLGAGGLLAAPVSGPFAAAACGFVAGGLATALAVGVVRAAESLR